jgi:hypothetical protein
LWLVSCSSGTSDDDFLAFLRQHCTSAHAFVATDNAVSQAKFVSDPLVGQRVRAATAIPRHPDGDGLHMTNGPFGKGRTLRHTTLFDAAADLLTCASADGPFMGSFQSSFSDTIGRLRRLHGRVHPDDDHRFADVRGQPNLRSFAANRNS